MGFLVLSLGLPLLGLLLRLAAKLRLAIPLLYALIAPTVFHSWFYAHHTLATGIGYGLFGLAALSWVITLAGKVRELAEDYQEEQAAMELLAHRVRQARANGDLSVSTEGLWR